MGSDFCHSVENQNKVFTPRTSSRLYTHLHDLFLETKMFDTQYPLFCHRQISHPPFFFLQVMEHNLKENILTKQMKTPKKV